MKGRWHRGPLPFIFLLVICICFAYQLTNASASKSDPAGAARSGHLPFKAPLSIKESHINSPHHPHSLMHSHEFDTTYMRKSILTALDHEKDTHPFMRWFEHTLKNHPRFQGKFEQHRLWTIFAPSHSALKSFLSSTHHTRSSYLLRHFIPDQSFVLYDSLPTKVIRVQTLDPKVQLTVCDLPTDEECELGISQLNSTTSDDIEQVTLLHSEVLVRNRMSGNGVIHVIDRVLGADKDAVADSEIDFDSLLFDDLEEPTAIATSELSEAKRHSQREHSRESHHHHAPPHHEHEHAWKRAPLPHVVEPTPPPVEIHQKEKEQLQAINETATSNSTHNRTDSISSAHHHPHHDDVNRSDLSQLETELPSTKPKPVKSHPEDDDDSVPSLPIPVSPFIPDPNKLIPLPNPRRIPAPDEISTSDSPDDDHPPDDHPPSKPHTKSVTESLIEPADDDLEDRLDNDTAKNIPISTEGNDTPVASMPPTRPPSSNKNSDHWSFNTTLYLLLALSCFLVLFIIFLSARCCPFYCTRLRFRLRTCLGCPPEEDDPNDLVNFEAIQENGELETDDHGVGKPLLVDPEYDSYQDGGMRRPPDL